MKSKMKYREVEIRMKVRVPEDVDYVTVDEDGCISGFTTKPFSGDVKWEDLYDDDYVAMIFEVSNWRECLFNVPNIVYEEK